MADEKKFLKSAARSASYNMLLQVLFRALTFVMNAFVLRFISKELLGLVNVRLTLLYATILFVAREAFRKACLSKSVDKNWTLVINLLWCTVPVGILTSLLLGWFWLSWLDAPGGELGTQYCLGVLSFSLSACLELLSEPLWVIAQAQLFVRLKVVVEGFAILTKCLLTVLFVTKFTHLGLTAFCLAQLAHSIVYVGLYYVYFIVYIRTESVDKKDFPVQSCRDLLPRTPPGGGSLISAQLAHLTWSFFKQSFLKQLLTEGERYIMTFFNVLTLGEQGVHDVINNLGSLVARFVFQPLEESYYILFAQMLTRGAQASEQTQSSVSAAAQALQVVLKFVVLVGITIIVFGYSYSFLLLDIYGGDILSSGEGPTLLRWYCIYVLVLAVNGITEAFMFAVMSKDLVDKYNYKMLLFSVIFLFSSLFLAKLGSVGFVLANCLNMLIRIYHSIHFIQEFFHSTNLQPVWDSLPSVPVCVAYGAAMVSMAVSESYLCCDRGWNARFLHVGFGACWLAVVAVLVLYKESDLSQFIREHWFSSEKGKSE